MSILSNLIIDPIVITRERTFPECFTIVLIDDAKGKENRDRTLILGRPESSRICRTNVIGKSSKGGGIGTKREKRQGYGEGGARGGMGKSKENGRKRGGGGGGTGRDAGKGMARGEDEGVGVEMERGGCVTTRVILG